MKFWLRLDRRWERRQVAPEAETPEEETKFWRGERETSNRHQQCRFHVPCFLDKWQIFQDQSDCWNETICVQKKIFCPLKLDLSSFWSLQIWVPPIWRKSPLTLWWEGNTSTIQTPFIGWFDWPSLSICDYVTHINSYQLKLAETTNSKLTHHLH